jgi:hypothetical protein
MVSVMSLTINSIHMSPLTSEFEPEQGRSVRIQGENEANAEG